MILYVFVNKYSLIYYLSFVNMYLLLFVKSGLRRCKSNYAKIEF